MNLYRDILNAFMQSGIKAISQSTAATVLAVIYVFGNDERLTHNAKLMADVEYIMDEYHIRGGDIPDEEMQEAAAVAIKRLEAYDEQHNEVPPDVAELMRTRYGIEYKNHLNP